MTDKEINNKIKNMIEQDDVVLFMKGDPDFPQCGFSANAVGILNYFKVDFKSYNVLESNELRQGIKDFSNWPTVPQIYIKGEFIGGSDILKEIAENGEIDKILDEKKINYSSPDR
jgi:monothiol glutaredoxin